MDVNEKIKALVDSLQELGDAISTNLSSTQVLGSDGLPAPSHAFDKTEEQKDQDKRKLDAEAIGEEVSKKQMEFFDKLLGTTNKPQSKNKNPWTTTSDANVTAKPQPKLGAADADPSTNLREIKPEVESVRIKGIDKKARENLADALTESLEESSIWDRMGKAAGNFGNDMDWSRLIPLIGALLAGKAFQMGSEKFSEHMDEWGSSWITTLKTILPTGTFKSLAEIVKRSSVATGKAVTATSNAVKTAQAGAKSRKAAVEALEQAVKNAGKNADDIARLSKLVSEESIKLIQSVTSYGDDAVKMVSTAITTSGADAGKLVANAIKTSGTEAGKIVATAITNNGVDAGKVVSKVLSDTSVEAAEVMAKSIRSGGDEAAKAISSVMGKQSTQIVKNISQQTRNITLAADKIGDAAKLASTTMEISNKQLLTQIDKLKNVTIPTAPKPTLTSPTVTPEGTISQADTAKINKVKDQATKELAEQLGDSVDSVSKSTDDVAKSAKATVDTANTTAKAEAQAGKQLAKNADEVAKSARIAANTTKLSTKAIIGLSTAVSYGSAAARFSDTNILTGEKKDRDYIGGTLDVISGTVGLVPVVGQGASLIIDGVHIALDASEKGSRIKKYVNRLGADTEAMKEFAKNVETQVKNQEKELSTMRVGLKDTKSIVKMAQIAAKNEGGWTYQDRTENLRDELVDAIKKHGSNISDIHDELNDEAKEQLKMIEKSQGVTADKIIQNLVDQREYEKYQTSTMSAWQYTPSETRTRLKTGEDSKLFEAANSLGMQAAGVQLADKKQEWAVHQMKKQFMGQQAVTIGNQTIDLENIYDDGYIQSADLKKGAILTNDTMAELKRLKESKAETDKWVWSTLKQFGIEGMMSENDENKQRRIQDIIVKKLDELEKQQTKIDEMRDGSVPEHIIDEKTGEAVATRYKFGNRQQGDLEVLMNYFKDERGMTDQPDTYDHLLENIQNEKDPYKRASGMKMLQDMINTTGLDASDQDDEFKRAIATQSLNEEIWKRASATGQQLQTPTWDMEKVELENNRPAFPHTDSNLMIKSREQQQQFNDNKQLMEKLELNLESQLNLNKNVGTLIKQSGDQPGGTTSNVAMTNNSQTIIKTDSPDLKRQRAGAYRRLFVNE